MLTRDQIEVELIGRDPSLLERTKTLSNASGELVRIQNSVVFKDLQQVSAKELVRGINTVVPYKNQRGKMVAPTLRTRKAWLVRLNSTWYNRPGDGASRDVVSAAIRQYQREIDAENEKKGFSGRHAEIRRPLSELKNVWKVWESEVDTIASAQGYLRQKYDLADKAKRMVVSALYTLRPAARLDYGALRLVKPGQSEPKTGNALVFNDDGFTIVLRNYKTAARYGEKRFETPPELSTAIRKHLQVMEPQKYLLESQDGEPLPDSTMRDCIRLAFGDGYTSTLLRKIWATDFPKTQGDSKRLAAEMMHGAGTALSVYNRS